MQLVHGGVASTAAPRRSRARSAPLQKQDEMVALLLVRQLELTLAWLVRRKVPAAGCRLSREIQVLTSQTSAE
eukprot:3217707-Pleurochrysis_carterae.AAC.1